MLLEYTINKNDVYTNLKEVLKYNLSYQTDFC